MRRIFGLLRDKNECRNRGKIQEDQKEGLQNRKAPDRHNFRCRFIANGTVRTSFCCNIGKCGLRWLKASAHCDLSRSIAVAKQCLYRHGPTRGVKFLGEARDHDRMASRLCKPIVETERNLECRPADCQDLGKGTVHLGRDHNFVLSLQAHWNDGIIPVAVFGQVGKIRQAAPIDLS